MGIASLIFLSDTLSQQIPYSPGSSIFPRPLTQWFFILRFKNCILVGTGLHYSAFWSFVVFFNDINLGQTWEAVTMMKFNLRKKYGCEISQYSEIWKFASESPLLWLRINYPPPTSKSLCVYITLPDYTFPFHLPL